MSKEVDTIGIIALVLTFISFLFSFNLSSSDITLSVSIFVLILVTYFYFTMRGIIDFHQVEIKRLNEKVNIYKDIAYLKAMVDKRGQVIPLDILMRTIQIGAIVFAVYMILKAIGFSF
ncbi:MAG: hypothetical protein Q8N88_05860 [Nanoarchaeota archaeon]|nr:hypothetical protein [Nanoarchaeota archaeon]